MNSIRAFILGIVALSLCLLPLGVQAQPSDPGAAIFRVVTIERTPKGGYQSAGWGTAFFISKDGTALTAAHVVRHAVNHPDRYSLMAIVAGELYEASVVCATKMSDELLKTFGRDISEIKLAPFMHSFSRWVYKANDGHEVVLGTAHRGDLPEFPSLSIGGMATGHVRVVGFGALFSLPTRWTAEGYVSALPSGFEKWKTDSTPVFAISFARKATGGDSGSPVLNDQGEVVGLFTWISYDADFGVAEASSVLLDPCP